MEHVYDTDRFRRTLPLHNNNESHHSNAFHRIYKQKEMVNKMI